MKIVFLSNFINHYQIPLSDELFKLTGGEYHFIETQPMPESFRKGGFSNYDRPYIVKAWKDKATERLSFTLAEKADILIAGGGKYILPYERKRLCKGKLTLEYGERPLKRGIINAFSKTNVLTQLHYHLLFYNKPFYKLCVSAYTANDMYLQRCFKNRCFKFGYFPEIPIQSEDEMISLKRQNAVPKIIWCARMIKWKHPELAVLLAEKLRLAGYDFEMNIIGSGPLKETIEDMVLQKQLESNVHLLGNFPNAQVLQQMALHDIFLFTSDRNEGWGVVLNEAMGQMCCPVASHMIGAVPFLITNKTNGLIYKSGDIDSLYDNVKYLFDHPDKMRHMAKSAYQTISTLWTPKVAAERLITFCEGLMDNQIPIYQSGPLSIAYPINL